MFRNVFLEKYSTFKGEIWSFVQVVAPTNHWLATLYVSNYSTPVNFKKKGGIWRQILEYRFFCVSKASDFPSC